MTSNISDDADFLLSLVPFLDAHHVRTDRIEAIANRLRVMPTEEMIEAGVAAMGGNKTCGDAVVAIYTAMQSTLLKEG